MLTEDEILKIKKPEDLFSKGNESIIKSEFRDLAKVFHPDVKGSKAVFAHINDLKNKAFELLENGVWAKNGVHKFKTIGGDEFKITYRYRTDFELGFVCGTDLNVFYFIEKKHKDLYSNARKQVKFNFIDAEMKAEFERFLPSYYKILESKNHYIMATHKTSDVVPLRGLYRFFEENVPPTHVAWIMSSLCNMLCYLHWAKKEHLAINMDSYFVSPEHHSGLLLGNWFYCKNEGEKISVVPAETYHLMSKRDVEKKIAGYRTDAELVKNIGRILMGKYMSKKKYPEYAPMIDWLNIPSNSNPYKMFASWDNTLHDTFGKRNFIKIDTPIEAIYKSI